MRIASPVASIFSRRIGSGQGKFAFAQSKPIWIALAFDAMSAGFFENFSSSMPESTPMSMSRRAASVPT